ncbi:MAG: class I adenylate cyclase [Desulfovibrio sp.]|nr:class I adenylate cyclase [Desulfovibrio sp.]
MSQGLHAIAAALRGLVRTGGADAARTLPELVACAQDALSGALSGIGPAAPRPLLGDEAAAAGECVFLMGALLRGQRDPVLSYRLFQFLAGAGRLGRVYAAQHVQARVLPLPQFSALMQALPGHDCLALLNDLLLDCPAEDKQFAAWLRTLLPAPGKLDAREALLFLKTLAPSQAGDGAALARPLREALLAAGLAESLAEGFIGSPAPAEAEAMLLAVEALAVPALHAEALAYALRTAGGEGPSRLPVLLAAPPDLEPRDAALLAEMRRLALLPEAPERLLGAARTEPEMLGLVLADLVSSGGVYAQAGLRLLPMLPRLGVESALAALADGPEAADLRHAAEARLMSVLAALEPDFLRRAAKTMGGELGLGDLSGPVAQGLGELLRARPKGAPPPFSAAPWLAQALPAGPASPPPKAAQNRRAGLAEALKNAMTPLKDQDFSHSSLEGELVEGAAVSGADLSRSRFESVVFRRVRFSSCLLAQCTFEDCTFLSCSFSGSDLTHSLFRGCRIGGASFEGTDLSRARIEACAIGSSSFTDASLCGALFAKTRLESVSLRTCALTGAHLLECALSRLSSVRSDLSGTLFERCVCRDMTLSSSQLAAARFTGSEVCDTVLVRSPAPGLAVYGGHTDNPRMAQAEEATRARCLDTACREGLELPPALLQGQGAAFVGACLARFLRVDEARRTLSALRGQDQRRRELAWERLTEAQGQFLELLPVLLATTVFDEAKGLEDVPACSIAGQERLSRPGPNQRAALERLFPGQAAPGRQADAPEPALVLEAVYAIGSLGSVAQKPSSDVDCWVCARPGPGLPQAPAACASAMAGLSRKLQALEAWAWEHCALELHFFPMDLENVRNNDFGMSDKESSGSAQAALLKEEFYRTALKLAGRDLLWWAAPPAATQREAQALLADLSRLAPRLAAELVDLGQPSPIPPQEYFGACLWQIVKALHSPYKSVMKLGLLEKYADQGQDMRLLCDRIKEAVLRGRRLAEDVDPYLSLFTSIRKHYRQLDDAGSLALIGECLRLKADVPAEDLPAEFGARGLPGGADGGANGRATDVSTFASALRLGGLVNQFMISAYRRIQEGIRAGAGAAQISPEDLTRLGRRIAANFAQHEHKVGLVPFLSEGLAFSELFFYAEKAPGKRTIWGVKGKDRNSGKAAVETLAPIRRDTDVVRLIAWLLFNGLYDPRQAVQAERSLAPIALLDLQALLAELFAFFPRKTTLEPDLDEYLLAERVTRAFVIANLPVPTDKNKILSVSVLYATNWGEVFCQSFDNPPLTLQKAPLAFLRDNLAKPMTRQPELRFFQPKKSVAPRLKLA